MACTLRSSVQVCKFRSVKKAFRQGSLKGFSFITLLQAFLRDLILET